MRTLKLYRQLLVAVTGVYMMSVSLGVALMAVSPVGGSQGLFFMSAFAVVGLLLFAWRWADRRGIMPLGWAAPYCGAVWVLAVLMAIFGQAEQIAAIAFVALVGLPSVAVALLLIPLRMVLDAANRIWPQFREDLERAVRTTLAVVIWVGLYSAILVFTPFGRSPFSLLVMLPLAVVAVVVSGLGLIRFPTERLLGWPLVVLAISVQVATFAAIAAPNFSRWVSGGIGRFDELFVEPPRPIAFVSTNDFVFVDPAGRPMIGYVAEPDGGFQLFQTRTAGQFSPDGRVILLADTDSVRQQIRGWIDQETAKRSRHESDRIKREHDQQEALATAKAEKERQQAETQRLERLKSYVKSLPKTQGTAVLYCRDSTGTSSESLTLRLAQRLEFHGLPVISGALTDAFAEARGFDLVASGKGQEEVRIMGLAELKPQLVLVDLGQESFSPARGVSGVVTLTRPVQIALIDARNGSVIHNEANSDLRAAGANQEDARGAFEDRLAEWISTRPWMKSVSQ